MKKNLLKSVLLALMVLVGGNAWADEINATLVHTASSGVPSANAGEYVSTIDAEQEYINNSAFGNKNWQGAAYAEFSFEIPAGQIIKSASMVWNGVGSSKNRDTDVMYVNAGEKLDYSETGLGSGTAEINLPATKIETVNFPANTTKEFTTDVTSAVKAVAGTQSYIIFKFTNNVGAGNLVGKGASSGAPTLVITTVADGIDASLATLLDAIKAAQAKADSYGIGEILFTYPASEIAPLTAAIAKAQAAYDAKESKEAVDAAIETLNAFVAAFAPAFNAPAANKTYTFELRLGGETPLYMALAEGGVTIAEEATPLKFIATENAGQYNLSDAEGTLFVGLAGGNAWTMSTAADKKAAWTFTALSDGAYRINNLVTAGRFVGTNAADKAAGSSCYADKQASNGNIDWIITEVESQDPEPAAVEGTFFSADVIATAKIGFATGTTEITSEQATIVGGKIFAISEQEASKELIGKQGSNFMFCMTNNNTYFKVDLDNALAVGDTIAAKTYSRTDTNLGLFISTAATRPNECTTKLSIASVETAAYEDLSSYVVTEGDGLVGAETIYIYRETGKSTYFDEFKITRKSAAAPAEESDLMKEAKALAADADAVAVGKLIDAITAAETSGDETALQAAVDQFKKDNADQEKDQTAKVATNGWKKFETNDAAGVCATQYAPAIKTYDGRETQLAEVYEGTAATTGQIIYQDITGLTNGQYKVGFYGNAFFTSGRGFDSDMADGAEDVAYVFANDKKEFITAHIATSTTENDFRQFNVEVTDGTIKLGMGKDKAGTNWHTMQIYQLTWFTTAKEVYAADKATMQAAIAAAQAEAGNANKIEGKEALNAAIEAAQAALASNKLNITEFEAEIKALTDAIAAFKAANLVKFDGVYYIQAANGKYLAGGHSWGTRGIVNEAGLDFTLASDENNKVTFDSKLSNGGNNHFMGNGLFMDSGAYGWSIEKTGEDTYTISDGSQYLTVDENDEIQLAAKAADWKFIKAEDFIAAKLAAFETATKDKGVDATFLLQNPNFNRNDQRVSAWTVSEDCTNKNLNGGADDTHFNGCAESYHSVFTISQTIANAPKGLYKLTAQGFYRQDGETAEDVPVFFIGDATGAVPAKTGAENSMTEAGTSFSEGTYTIEPIEYTLESDGELTVGIKGTATSQWVIFDNFVLTYYGAEKKGLKYTVNEVVNDQVVRTTTGEAEAAGTVKVPYRHYNVVDGKLYSKGVTSKEYNYSFNLTADGQVENITGYNATGTQDIVFLSEGEDIEGLTSCTSANTAIRSSNSASAYAAEADVEIVKLPAGTYKLTAAIYDSAKTPNSMWYFIAGTDTIAKLNCTAVNYQELSSQKFTLEAETSLYLAKGGNGNMGLDLVYIQAVEAETPVYAYTVNEVIGETIVRTTTGTGEKASVIKVPFREYNVLDGKLYKKAQVNKEFNYSFTLNNDAQVEKLEYTATDVEGVVFLKEGEDIEGLTKITTGNSAIRSSNSAAGYAAESDVEFATLPAGVYKLTACIYDSSKTPDSHWKFLAGEKEIADLNCTVVNIQELTSDEFTLTEESKLYIGKGGSNSMGIDFVYIVKVGDIDTGINTLKAEIENGAVYNLNGQKVQKAQKGLYIIGGKKVVVK